MNESIVEFPYQQHFFENFISVHTDLQQLQLSFKLGTKAWLITQAIYRTRDI